MSGRELKLQLPSPTSNRLGEALLPYFQIEKELLTGHLKQNLTQWWLDLIEERVEHFLKQLPPPFSYDALQQV